MTFPFGETVTHLDGTVTGKDDLGSDTSLYPVKAIYSGVAVAPSDGNATAANERTQGQEMVIRGLALYGLPAGTAVSALDRFIVRGGTWQVVGEAGDWVSPFTGWHPGIVVQLERVTG